jgi:hypothetical protein
VRYTHDKGGTLRGVSFEVQGIGVKGQEVGFKGAQLREALAEATTKQVLHPHSDTPKRNSLFPVPAATKPELPKLSKRVARKGPAM